MVFFDTYQAREFDEVVTDGRVRDHYVPLVERLESLDAAELAARVGLTEAIFRRQGITFALGDGADSIERTWPLDLVPRIITAAEWNEIEAGLRQRVQALNLFLNDLYAGSGDIIEDGIIPRWIVESSSGYMPEVRGIAVPHRSHSVISGVDLVRGDDGVVRVLEDNLRVPSGVSYMLENRVAMTRVLPVAFSRYRVRPVNHYGVSLLSALRSLTPTGDADPTVVILTPGIFNSAYFEHAFLARQMGVELVEGRDLVVVDQAVYMRTTRGLARVDVIYRRIGDEFLDPVVFRSDSLLGVPGLMTAVRAGNVTLANAVGNGVADDKGVYPFVPAMIRYYLNEDPILPNVTTYLPWEDDQREWVLAHLDRLVVKPVAESGGHGIVIGPAADDESLARVAAQITSEPRAYIAQDVVQLSTHPSFVSESLAPRHIDLRPFVLSGETIEVIPGGLTRVALRQGSLIVNSSQGGGSKDTWVLVDS